MLRYELRTLLIAATLTAPAAWTADAVAMQAEQGWAAVARCAQAESGPARHDCLDRVLRDAGLLTEAMNAQQQRRAFGLEDRPAIPVPPAAAAPARARATAATPPASKAVTATPEAADRLEADIATVQKSADGRLSLTTVDGAVWRQTESVEMPQSPVAGDRLSIRKGAMSGYRCSIASTRLTFRCARSR